MGIGSRENISFWDQKWLYDSTSLDNPWPNNSVVAKLKVSDLMIPNGKQWNLILISSLVGRDIAQKVFNTSLFEAVQEDKLIWKLEINGRFSACSAYWYYISEAIDTTHLSINER